MAEGIAVQPDTNTALGAVTEFLKAGDSSTHYYWYFYWFQYWGNTGILRLSLETLRCHLLKAEERLALCGRTNDTPVLGSETPDDWRWLAYTLDMDVIPVHDHGLTVSTSKLIFRPEEVPNLVRFVTGKEPGDCIDLESHDFGYHFHFLNHTRRGYHKTDLLLTFDPADPASPDAPLHAEKHREGNYAAVDIAALSPEMRRSIYEACHAVMTRKGIRHFKRPAHTSRLFLP